MPSSAAISATAVLAKPNRRNSPSAACIIRARVSSGLVLTCGFMVSASGRLLELNTDEFNNSSVCRCQAGAIALAGGHPGQDAIPADEMVVQCGRDMGGGKDRDSKADQAVNEQHLIREGPILVPKGRQVEQAEDRDRGRIGDR